MGVWSATLWSCFKGRKFEMPENIWKSIPCLFLIIQDKEPRVLEHLLFTASYSRCQCITYFSQWMWTEAQINKIISLVWLSQKTGARDPAGRRPSGFLFFWLKSEVWTGQGLSHTLLCNQTRYCIWSQHLLWISQHDGHSVMVIRVMFIEYLGQGTVAGTYLCFTSNLVTLC